MVMNRDREVHGGNRLNEYCSIVLCSYPKTVTSASEEKHLPSAISISKTCKVGIEQVRPIHRRCKRERERLNDDSEKPIASKHQPRA